jgi:hypothetical protein
MVKVSSSLAVLGESHMLQLVKVSLLSLAVMGESHLLKLVKVSTLSLAVLDGSYYLQLIKMNHIMALGSQKKLLSCQYNRYFSLLIALIGPVQNMFFLTIHYFTSFVPNVLFSRAGSRARPPVS